MKLNRPKDTVASNENECKKEMLILAGELFKLQERIYKWVLNNIRDSGDLEIIENEMKRFSQCVTTLCHLSHNDKSDFIHANEGKI